MAFAIDDSSEATEAPSLWWSPVPAALVLAGLFLVGMVYNLAHADWGNAALGAGVALVLAGVHFFARAGAIERARTLRWLRANETEIRAGGVRYQGVLVTPRTGFRELLLCVSFVVFTFRVRSRLLLEDRDAVVAPAFAHTVTTLLLGWWGLPGGPIFTCQALFRNLTGGRRLTVEMLLAPPPVDDD